jgi:hypothetical protein
MGKINQEIPGAQAIENTQSKTRNRQHPIAGSGAEAPLPFGSIFLNKHAWRHAPQINRPRGLCLLQLDKNLIQLLALIPKQKV